MEGKRGGLGVLALVLMALGSCVGGAFFLGSAVILRTAGRASVLAFVVGSVITYVVLMALAELTVSIPASGSFREYAEQAYGPGLGFVVGWVYWAGLVLGLSSEATAASLFLHLWLPWPVWLLSLLIVGGVTGVNLLSVNLFARVESAMSAIKNGAIVLFALLALILVAGLWPGHAVGGLHTFLANPALPHGISGLAGGMLMVMFSFSGFEVIGFAAPEARQPQRTVPRAVVLTALALTGVFILGMLALLALLPVNAVDEHASPLVSALRLHGLTGWATAMNLVVMSASLSTMLVAIYGLSRMLQSLAEERQAPAALKRERNGNPVAALLATSITMALGVGVGQLLPSVYLFLASSGAFALIFAYLVILASHIRLRKRVGCPEGGCRLPGYPITSYVGIAALLGVLGAMPFVQGQGAGLIAGIALVLAASIAYVALIRPRRQPPAGGGSAPGGRVATEPEALPTEGERLIH